MPRYIPPPKKTTGFQYGLRAFPSFLLFLMLSLSIFSASGCSKPNNFDANFDTAAKRVYSILFDEYRYNRKYTFGLRQPRNRDYTHAVFSFVQAMGGGVFIENGSENFYFDIRTTIQRTSGRAAYATATVLLFDSTPLSGGQPVLMSSKVNVFCPKYDRLCNQSLSAAVFTALSQLQ